MWYRAFSGTAWAWFTILVNNQCTCTKTSSGMSSQTSSIFYRNRTCLPRQSVARAIITMAVEGWELPYSSEHQSQASTVLVQDEKPCFWAHWCGPEVGCVTPVREGTRSSPLNPTNYSHHQLIFSFPHVKFVLIQCCSCITHHLGVEIWTSFWKKWNPFFFYSHRYF